MHDFNKFPELANSQMQIYYWESPHKQILEDFNAKVEKVIDGDTIKVSCNFRDFIFPVRMLDINAPEMNEGGREAKDWLRNQIEGEEIMIIMDSSRRVGKWGRLLGKVFFRGRDVGEEMIFKGLATTFEARDEAELPDLNKELNIGIWF